MGPGYFWWGGMWILPVIMICIMLVVVYLIFGRRSMRLPWQDQGGARAGIETLETPLDILKRRYANGEITKDEFEQMKKDVSS